MAYDDESFDFQVNEDGTFSVTDGVAYVNARIAKMLEEALDAGKNKKRRELIKRLLELANKEKPEFGSPLWDRLVKDVPEYQRADQYIRYHQEILESAGVHDIESCQVTINDDRTITVKMEFWSTDA